LNPLLFVKSLSKKGYPMRKYMKDAAPAIRVRKNFSAATISGEGVHTKTKDGLEYSSYVIYSYRTPIAIFRKGQWYETNERFSQTTSTQQSAIRVILKEAGINNLVTLSPAVFAAQLRELGI
jgi:hypothetical protein